MPLLKRKSVPLLPQPTNLNELPKATKVFLLKVTGEIFLDYESYAARMTFLNTRVFQCEFSGKNNLTYFAALESERAESRIVRERFPDELKGRVLATVQFQIMGRLDALVDLVYERYKDRFFCGEKVFVDLQGDKYFAKISSVFPPAAIRNSAQSSTDPVASTSAAVVDTPGVEDYSKLVHKIGTDLSIPIEDARRDDDPTEYLYTIQLMDEQHTFEGSFMETKAVTVSRDRLAFSKSILKRYIRECVQRESPIGSPWVVKPVIALAFNIPTAQSAEAEAKNKIFRDGKLAKRRKIKDELEPTATGTSSASKRRKTGDHEPVEKKPALPAAKPIKYPIEDLDLDPMSIHDGRILRRVNSELPTLPPKPVPSKELLVPEDLFHDFLMIWNCLNVFSKPLSLSPFSIDDFASALKHVELEPRCILLAEIHACLTNVIATDASRVLGTTGAPPLATSKGAVIDSEDVDMEGISTIVEVEEGVEGELEEGEEEITEVEEEFDALIRKGISHSKRWDRMAKLKSAEGREGWERHMIGALCQRGGPVSMPSLYAILKHLFEGADLTAPNPPYVAPSTAAELAPDGSVAGEDVDQLENSSVVNDAAASVIDENAILDTSNPPAAYLTLDLRDKIDILSYLCTLVLGSKLVRSSIDESEGQLTEFRKQKADVNKERRALLEQKAINDGKVKEEPGAVDLSAVANGNGVNGSSTNGHATPARAARDKSIDIESNNGGALRPPGSDIGTVEAEVGEDEEEDQLEDDDGAEEVKDEDFDDDNFSEEGGEVTGGGAVGPTGALGARRIALEEKRSEKKAADAARSIELAQARIDAKAKSAGKKQADKLRIEVEEGLKQNSKKDDFVEREFRRYQGVARSRPLGKDRFFNRYWWFDGVGGMHLVGPNNSIQYGTGRLFVQGPTKEDWADVCARVGGAEAMEEKRSREDVDPKATLQVDEWAFYEDEEQIDALQSWLNGKGVRELSLKNSLAKWKEYILAGARKRQADAITPVQHIDSRRSSRSKGGNDLTGYLAYSNKIASR